jgi:hypothetical protein
MSAILKGSLECLVVVPDKTIEEYTAARPHWTAKQIGDQLWNTKIPFTTACGLNRAAAIEMCESDPRGVRCGVAFFQEANGSPLIEITSISSVMASYKSAELSRKRQKEEQERIEKINAEKEMLIKYREACTKFGFKDGSEEMSKCMFDMYKMGNSKPHPPTVIQNNTGDSSAVRAMLEEQKRQREFEASMELMQRGLDMMNPPKPRITCKYNQYTKTTVCD